MLIMTRQASVSEGLWQRVQGKHLHLHTVRPSSSMCVMYSARAWDVKHSNIDRFPCQCTMKSPHCARHSAASKMLAATPIAS